MVFKFLEKWINIRTPGQRKDGLPCGECTTSADWLRSSVLNSPKRGPSPYLHIWRWRTATMHVARFALGCRPKKEISLFEIGFSLVNSFLMEHEFFVRWQVDLAGQKSSFPEHVHQVSRDPPKILVAAGEQICVGFRRQQVGVLIKRTGLGHVVKLDDFPAA